ncbi:MAG TPA: histone deacetylase, partial [Solirubrobacterales bacterium]|nr:histone deacetylase [Solirubrobacterales bacterium]
HRDDPLAGCRLDASSYGRMASLVRTAAEGWGAPIGVTLEGGYDLGALAESVVATMSALSA